MPVSRQQFFLRTRPACRIWLDVVTAIALFGVAFFVPHRAYAQGPGVYAPYSPSIARGEDPALGREFDVVRIDKKKRYLIIDGGTYAGLYRGRTLCIYDEDDDEVGCYKILGTRPTSVVVQVPKKDFKLFKKGMVARVQPKDAVTAHAKGNSSFTFGYAFGALLPFRYVATNFSLDQKEAGGQSVWMPGKTVSSSPAVLRLMLGTAVSPTFGIQAGLLYRYLIDQVRQSDFDLNNADRYAEQRLHAVSFGLPIQARWTFPSENFLFILAEGIEWDYSQVQFRTWSVDDKTQERKPVVSYLSVLNTIGLRSDLGVAARLGDQSNVMLSVGIVVPLLSFGASQVAKVDATDWAPERDQQQDVIEAINHKPTHVGVEVPLTISVGF